VINRGELNYRGDIANPDRETKERPSGFANP